MKKLSSINKIKKKIRLQYIFAIAAVTRTEAGARSRQHWENQNRKRIGRTGTGYAKMGGGYPSLTQSRGQSARLVAGIVD